MQRQMVSSPNNQTYKTDQPKLVHVFTLGVDEISKELIISLVRGGFLKQQQILIDYGKYLVSVYSFSMRTYSTPVV